MFLKYIKHLTKYTTRLNLYDYLLIIFLIVFFLIAYSISIIRHQMFLSNAMDLGIYNQLVYQFSHFKYPASTVYPANPQGLFFLGDHITLFLPIESLFYWILGKNVLLYLQIIYLILGCIGLYKLIHLKYTNFLALLAALLFLSHYSIYSALSFDYHTNILGTMLIPWILYFYYTSNFKYFLLTTVVGLMTREDMSIYYFLIGIVLLYKGFKENSVNYKFILLLLSFSLVYFFLAFYIILPSLSIRPDSHISNWKFIPEVGNSLTSLMTNILENPAKILHLMTNQVEKTDKINRFLYSGGILFFFTDIIYLLPVIPLFILTLLSTEWGMWIDMGHYSILLSVWVPLTIILFSYKLKYKFLQISFPSIFILIYIKILLNFNLEPIKWTKFPFIFYKEYYSQRFNIPEIKEALKLIPENASVSASNHLVPHLAFRDKIIFFPNTQDAEYIAIIENDCIDRFYYFQNPISCFLELKKYLNNQKYKLIYNKNHVLVFQLKS